MVEPAAASRHGRAGSAATAPGARDARQQTARAHAYPGLEAVRIAAAWHWHRCVNNYPSSISPFLDSRPIVYEDDPEDTPPAVTAAKLRPLAKSMGVAIALAKPSALVASHPEAGVDDIAAADQRDLAPEVMPEAPTDDHVPATTPELMNQARQPAADAHVPAATPEPMDQDRQPAAPAVATQTTGDTGQAPPRGKRRRDRRMSGGHSKLARKRQARPTAAAAPTAAASSAAADAVPPGAADWTSEETHGGLLDRPLRLGRRPLWMRTLTTSLFTGLLDSGVALGRRRGTRKLRVGVHL